MHQIPVVPLGSFDVPLTSEQVSERLPSRPLLSSGHGSAGGIVVEHYKHPPSVIDLPPSSDALLVVHLKGPVAVEEKSDRSWTRKWTDKQHVSLTPPGQPVQRRFQARTEVLLLHLNPGFIDDVIEDAYEVDARQVELVPCFSTLDPTLDELAKLLVAEAAKPTDPAHSAMVEALERAIAITILREHSTLGRPAPPEPLRTAPARIRRVLEYVRGEAFRAPTLKEMAGIAGLSPTHFGRAFRAATGMPPHQYLLDLRMQRARRLLETTRLSITQIALECGFEQSTSFATSFKKLVGVSPRMWRAERQS